MPFERWLHVITMRVRALLCSRALDDDLAEELRRGPSTPLFERLPLEVGSWELGVDRVHRPHFGVKYLVLAARVSAAGTDRAISANHGRVPAV